MYNGHIMYTLTLEERRIVLGGGALAGILIKPTLSLLEVPSTSTEGFHWLKQQTKCVKKDLKDGLSNKRFFEPDFWKSNIKFTIAVEYTDFLFCLFAIVTTLV